MGWKFDKKNDHIMDFFRGMWPHTLRLIKSVVNWPDISHAFTNIFVEAARLSPYHSGHIWMVQFVVMVGVIVWLAVV